MLIKFLMIAMPLSCCLAIFRAVYYYIIPQRSSSSSNSVKVCRRDSQPRRLDSSFRRTQVVPDPLFRDQCQESWPAAKQLQADACEQSLLLMRLCHPGPTSDFDKLKDGAKAGRSPGLGINSAGWLEIKISRKLFGGCPSTLS